MHPKKKEILIHAIESGNIDVDEIIRQAESAGVSIQEGRWWVTKALRRLTEKMKKPKRPNIYVDGSCASGSIGIGVISTDLGIEISEMSNVDGTNNVAECLAVIRACNECVNLGVKGVNIHSDSDLVVNWTNGNYLQKSPTAKSYVPAIQELLKEIDGNIYWMPGRLNPADAYSRGGAYRANKTYSSPLEKVKNTPFADLRFYDFGQLKSGWDEFSKLRLPKLKSLISSANYRDVSIEFGEEGKRYVAMCLRWILRGLPIDKAIRKVRVDIEIGELAKNAKRRRRG